MFEDQFAMLEQRLTGMEKAVGELKGLQAHMAEFQTSQDPVIVLLTCMESQTTRLERVEPGTEEEDYVEEKD